jgi:predicted ATP-binding protein involved in virulence
VATNGAGKTSILDAIAVAFGPYIGAFDEAVGKHFEPSDIRQYRVRETATNEMEYASQGVRMEVTGFIPGGIMNSMLGGNPPTTWSRSLPSPKKAKTTIKDAKELIDYGKRMQRAARTPGNLTLLPLIAYYGTGRLYQQKKLTETKKIQSTSRTGGYTDCLDPASSYKSFVAWFKYWSFNAKDARIKAQETGRPVISTEFDGLIKSVSSAVNYCLAPVGWRDIEYSFSRGALVAHHEEYGELPVELLSDGIRNMIGMVADIAFRATKLNGYLGAQAATETPGIVLIDEVDMHLHPKWQQIVVQSLTTAFPKMQFIVTTHSPQVLTTVNRENIRLLGPDAEGIIRASLPHQEIKGLESAVALTEAMRVNPAPPVEEATWIADYTAMIEAGTHPEADGLALRQKLVTLYGENHPIILDADRLIRFQEFKLRKKSESKE